MRYLEIRTTASRHNKILTIQVDFDNLLWDKGVVLFKQPEFVKGYTEFLLSFARGRRVLVQYGHFRVDQPFLEWLGKNNLPYVVSKYSFSHLGDWTCYLDDTFEVVFEPPERLLPDLIRSYAYSDLLAFLITGAPDRSALQQVSAILTEPPGASSRSEKLLTVCDWLILTNDDGETVIIKSRHKDAERIVEMNLLPMRQALTQQDPHARDDEGGYQDVQAPERD